MGSSTINVKMKVLLALVFLSVGIFAEYCVHDSDCKETVCGPNFRLDCYERDRSHVCTCVATTDTSFTCSTPDVCGTKYGKCNYGDHTWHCIDQKCRCSYFG